MAKPNIIFNIKLDAILNIQKFIDQNAKIKIGVLSNEQRDDSEFGAVELAAVHEFGSQRRGIPQRSFLRQTMVNRKDDFKAEIESNRDTIMKRIASGQGDTVLEKMGITWRNFVLETFDAQGPGWAPLADSTIAQRKNYGVVAEKNPNASRSSLIKKARKGSKILQDTGEMKKSIMYMVEK